MMDIGIILLFGIVFIPVYVFVIASIFGKPKKTNVAFLVLGLPVSLAVTFIAGMWVLGKVMGLIMGI
ncbi:MAG: hypothetical protein HZB68_00070 [Candidatus Aenigmarchaeota archaeon]|nr:hypothetical protein [Candidatus Aenigmarchaeota archaeon]